jgi:hypothetical protein
MTGVYIGVDGQVRKIKGGYIGVDGQARKIKKGYIGVNGVARLCYVNNPFNPVFADNTWEEIALACQTNNIPDSWMVGDQKTMIINGTDYTIDIIGKNHDDYADGSGKAPLTFQLHECYTTNYAMNDSASNNGSWDSTAMRNIHLNNTILPLMPSEVQSSIRKVTKSTSKGSESSTLIRTSDKLFLLSEIEVFNTTTASFNGEGKQYEYYTKDGTTAKRKPNATSGIAWWLRSPVKDSAFRFITVAVSGKNTSQSNADNEFGMSYAFCF